MKKHQVKEKIVLVNSFLGTMHDPDKEDESRKFKYKAKKTLPF